MRGAYDVVVLRTGCGEIGRQAHAFQRTREVADPVLGAVLPVPQFRVEPAERVVPVVALHRGAHTHRVPEVSLRVVFGVVGVAFVEHGQAHYVPAHRDRPDPGGLDQPAGRDPGGRAGRVEPDVGGRHASIPRSRVRVTVAATPCRDMVPLSTSSIPVYTNAHSTCWIHRAVAWLSKTPSCWTRSIRSMT